jgi:predicted nucleotidyltransferase
MREQRLIEARDQLLAFAQQVFASNQDVVGVFLSGSLAAGSSDAYSDIDLRVVVRPEREAWFIEHRCEIPRHWPDFLFNEWRPGTRHCVSHFRFFVKIDIFYFSENSLLPSPWYTLPTRILFDPHGLIERLLQASGDFRFEITDEDLDYSISKGLAAAHEVYRRTHRQELIFAQTLLDELRFHIIQADDWLHDRTPRTQLFSKFDYRGSPEVIHSLRASFCNCSTEALRASLIGLCRLYRQQVEQLHNKFKLSRPLQSDLEALDLLAEFTEH